MKVRVWRYQVPDQVRAEFEREYGPAGSWALLFARSTGFLDTCLYVDVTSPGSYLTVDRFAGDRDWDQFLDENQTAYDELGSRLDHLTSAQEELG